MADRPRLITIAYVEAAYCCWQATVTTTIPLRFDSRSAWFHRDSTVVRRSTVVQHRITVESHQTEVKSKSKTHRSCNHSTWSPFAQFYVSRTFSSVLGRISLRMRRHNNTTTSDPKSAFSVVTNDPDLLQKFRSLGGFTIILVIFGHGITAQCAYEQKQLFISLWRKFWQHWIQQYRILLSENFTISWHIASCFCTFAQFSAFDFPVKCRCVDDWSMSVYFFVGSLEITPHYRLPFPTCTALQNYEIWN